MKQLDDLGQGPNQKKHRKSPKLETGFCQESKNVEVKNKNAKTIPKIDDCRDMTMFSPRSLPTETV